jgi:hypothetical protein
LFWDFKGLTCFKAHEIDKSSPQIYVVVHG